MSDSTEIDFEGAKPIKLAAEVSPEKTVAFFRGEEQTPLHPKEITEAMAARLFENLEEKKHLDHLIEMDKADIKDLAKDQTNIIVGKYVLLLTHKKGQRKVNWAKLSKDLIGKISDEDLDKYTEEGESSVSLSVKKLD